MTSVDVRAKTKCEKKEKCKKEKKGKKENAEFVAEEGGKRGKEKADDQWEGATNKKKFQQYTLQSRNSIYNMTAAIRF